MGNPLLQRLGILSPDEKINSVLIRRDGWIAAFVSGLAEQSGPRGMTLCNTVLLEDEKVYGTLHIAFGHNSDMPGGQNMRATHRDFLFKKPNIINMETGEYIMRDGELT